MPESVFYRITAHAEFGSSNSCAVLSNVIERDAVACEGAGAVVLADLQGTTAGVRHAPCISASCVGQRLRSFDQTVLKLFSTGLPAAPTHPCFAQTSALNVQKSSNNKKKIYIYIFFSPPNKALPRGFLLYILRAGGRGQLRAVPPTPSDGRFPRPLETLSSPQLSSLLYLLLAYFNFSLPSLL